jgi:AcrR family transcriptional regulator
MRSDRQPRQRLAPEERREAILAAATEAFRDQSYDRVSLGSVAAAAGASEALVHKYFEGKSGVYVELVRRAVRELDERQSRAVHELADGVPARDRVRACALAYLDHVRDHPRGVSAVHRAPAGEPEAAAAVREAARADGVARLAGVLLADQSRRRDYALRGYVGFLDAACERWVSVGCPEDQRWPLVEAALGALQGALGDWGR